MSDLELAALQSGDLDAIEAIECACFSSPWRRADFEMVVSCSTLVSVGARRDGELCGYIVATLRDRDLVIANLAVAPRARRRGIASALLREIIDFAAVMRARCCCLQVRESNTAATTLYRRFGFAAVGRVLRYYSNPVEDAISMALPLAGAALIRPAAGAIDPPAAADAGPKAPA